MSLRRLRHTSRVHNGGPAKGRTRELSWFGFHPVTKTSLQTAERRWLSEIGSPLVYGAARNALAYYKSRGLEVN